jgi:hypothetical protein
VKSRKLFLGSSRRSSVELLTLSEWCRETLLANVNSQEEKSTDAGGTVRRSRPELVALRAILLNALFKQANAQTLTAEEMQRLIDRAD